MMRSLLCGLVLFVCVLDADPIDNLPVKTIKTILESNGASCSGCAEKKDFTNKLKEVMEEKNLSWKDIEAAQTQKQQETEANQSKNDNKQKKPTAQQQKEAKAKESKAKDTKSKAKETTAKKEKSDKEKSDKAKDTKASDPKTAKPNQSSTVSSRKITELTTFGSPEIIVCLNVLVFVLWQTNRTRKLVTSHSTFSWNALKKGRLWVIIAPAFVHTSILPMLHACYTIMNWGLPLCNRIGGHEFAMVYVAGAAAGAAGVAITQKVQKRPFTAVYGSTAAVTALIATFAVCFWNHQLSWNGVPMSPFQFVIVHAFVDSLLHNFSNEHIAKHVAGALIGAAVGWSHRK
eukprot:c213_g1_i2.p1 GENE.c213_g1_i2~~c213_g1_i2.p1  ORF type:complete len:346 (+),score=88.79 c213_g1_i2:37-1074(+)